MPEQNHAFVYWTDRSVSDSLSIQKYLREEFSQKEIDNFYKLLQAFEKLVLSFPKLYPVSTKNKKVHRAVLSKQLSVFYTLYKGYISVVAVLDNRVGYPKWP